MRYALSVVIAGTLLRPVQPSARKCTQKSVLPVIHSILASRSCLIRQVGSNASVKSTPRNNRVELKKAARWGRFFFAQYLNPETAVESRKHRQTLDAPSKTEKLLITNKVTTNFSVSLCTPISYLPFSRLTTVSRLKDFYVC